MALTPGFSTRPQSWLRFQTFSSAAARHFCGDVDWKARLIRSLGLLRSTRFWRQLARTHLNGALQLKARIIANVSALDPAPGVAFHERAPDAMDTDDFADRDAEVAPLPTSFALPLCRRFSGACIVWPESAVIAGGNQGCSGFCEHRHELHKHARQLCN